jgi:hypothetical protein
LILAQRRPGDASEVVGPLAVPVRLQHAGEITLRLLKPAQRHEGGATAQTGIDDITALLFRLVEGFDALVKLAGREQELCFSQLLLVVHCRSPEFLISWQLVRNNNRYF